MGHSQLAERLDSYCWAKPRYTQCFGGKEAQGRVKRSEVVREDASHGVGAGWGRRALAGGREQGHF